MIRGVREGKFGGRVYLVNPNYPEIDGLPCYPSLAALPETVDHVVIGVANARIEAQLAEAIRHGARAATIFASCYLPGDSDPPLTRRLAAMARAAGLQICGGNGMGFYNLEHGLRVCGFPPPPWLEHGSIALISHSGSAFSGLCHTDRRFRFSLAVSAGQELATDGRRLPGLRAGYAVDARRRPVPGNRARSRRLRRRTGEGAPARHSRSSS